MFTGMGASLADGIYTAAACLWAASLNIWIHKHNFWFSLCGGLFLLYLAYTLFKTKPKDLTVAKEGASLFGSFSTTLLLSFMSPMTTFLFLAMFESYGVFGENLSLPSNIWSLSLGAIVGSMIWWWVLSYSISKIYMVSPNIHFKRSLASPAGPTLFGKFLKLLWPELKKSPKLNLFVLINRIASLCIAGYGTFTLLKAF